MFPSNSPTQRRPSSRRVVGMRPRLPLAQTSAIPRQRMNHHNVADPELRRRHSFAPKSFRARFAHLELRSLGDADATPAPRA
jgi:hypothetical protein